MCKFTIPNIVPYIGVLEDIISDEDFNDFQVETDEEMSEDSEANTSEHSDSLSLAYLFCRNLLRINILYRMNLYDDLFVVNVHLWGIYFHSTIVSALPIPPARICWGCKNNQVCDPIAKSAHYVFHPQAFINSINEDNEWSTNQFFCFGCDRFLFQLNELSEIECCEDLENHIQSTYLEANFSPLFTD